MEKAQKRDVIFPLQKFKTYAAEEPGTYLHVAQQAEKYIAQYMRESEDGIYWINPDDGKFDLSFYSGCAGIVYFYIKLNKVCPEPRYEKIIRRGTAYLLANLEGFYDSDVIYDYSLPKMTKKGLYFGMGGIGLLFLEVYRNFDDKNAEAGAKAVTRYYLSKAKRSHKGTFWSFMPALAMDGGILLYLLDYYDAFPDDGLKNMILSAGEHYLHVGKAQKNGTLLYDGYGGFLPYSTPNWEFGNGGSGYTLTKLYEFSKDQRYLQAAVDCARYLLEIKCPQERGYLIPYRIYRFSRKMSIFYTGLCHGPVGTSRLLYQLYRLTGDEFWYRQIVELTKGLESLGVPEIQTPGLWNNVSYCCGHSGFLHFFLSLYHTEHNEHWRELAIRSANVLLGEMETANGENAKWKIAWSRVQPERQTEPIGFYDGAAGIAATLLELYLTETNQYSWHRLIDDPFPECAIG